MSRRRQDWYPKGQVTNLDEVTRKHREEVEQAAGRAYAARRAADAPGTTRLDYVGMGSYGIVFCDDQDVAWKVYRNPEGAEVSHPLFLSTVLQEEYGFLAAAAELPAVREYVAEAYGFFPTELVLARRCVRGTPGTWGDATRLWELYHRIAGAMAPAGWGPPEFKEDSFIIEPGGWAVLVDATGAKRLGKNLAAYVRDLLEGRRETYYRPHDLAFFVIREFQHGALEDDDARDLLRRLIEIDPVIRRSFGTPEILGL